MAKFNTILKALRVETGITQFELARVLGISKSSINMYERGEREPSIDTLEAIADFFNVDMDYLIGKSDIKLKVCISADQYLSNSYTPEQGEAPTAPAQVDIANIYGEDTAHAVSLFTQLDTIDKWRTIGSMEEMLRADKYDITKESSKKNIG